MKKPGRIILLLLVVLLLGGLAWLVFSVREPGGIDPKVLAILQNPAAWQEREPIFRELGTNIIPSVRFMIRQYDSPLKLRLKAIAYKLHLAKPSQFTAQEWHFYALEICRVADTNIRTELVPDWIYLVDHGNKQDRYDAFRAQLNGIGPEAVPVLLKALDSRNPRVREFAVQTIRIPSQAGVIIPAVLPKLQDPDETVRAVTMLTLVWLRPDPDTAEKIVPLIIPALSDPSALVRCDACNALRSFAPYSKPAVPDLVKCLKDPDPNVRKLAADALLLIDNEAAAKAGVK